MERQQQPSMKRRRTDDDEGELNSFVTELQKIMNVKMDTPGGKVFRRHCVMVHEENRRVEKEGGVAREVVTPLSLAVLKEMGFGGQDERDLMKQAEGKIRKMKNAPKIFDFDKEDYGGKNTPILQKISEVLSSWYQLQEILPTTSSPLFDNLSRSQIVRKIHMLNTEQLITFLIDGTTQQVRDVRADVARLMTVIFTQTDRFFYSTLKKVYADLMEADKRASEADLRAELASARADAESARADAESARADAAESKVKEAHLQTELEAARANEAELQLKLKSELTSKAELKAKMEEDRANKAEAENRVLDLENRISKYNEVMTNAETDKRIFVTQLEGRRILMYCNKTEEEHIEQVKEFVGEDVPFKIVMKSLKIPEAPGVRDLLFKAYSSEYGHVQKWDLHYESKKKIRMPKPWNYKHPANSYRIIHSCFGGEALKETLREVRKTACEHMLRKVFEEDDDPIFPEVDDGEPDMFAEWET
ncbi:hypothetical protein AbHV_ORF62_2 [Abalone herpesvirus Victoria/AUS/2009]|uniref:Uncharacterized protein n=1 Tax=Abalone herpesvirus (isolate Abalone/Australia/Victoria/2009) TaxID=1241371 RepID=K4JXC2_ABHV|nr:hypothetical protein AbHV_ORF62 [Abalone herpesvirus Victoria/AUS/2009]YP_006908765.1 hypothetical protein AbHV_ORF62_2 [Abalone herpesvirus Victoria/AUS/2009]AFU90074.1 hypothetical protein AbHV_ORF62 [Abalone herpesvirus Victoria/AUS/2009]AFU90125.1 hypothetical protein AbHV_ORF62_2 [Abalone herpesvirus Victoria/AUS/2009]